MGCGCGKRKKGAKPDKRLVISSERSRNCRLCGWPLSKVNKWDAGKGKKNTILKCTNRNCSGRKR